MQTLSIGPVPGIEPTTYISAVGRSTDGKIPTAVEVKFLRDDYFREHWKLLISFFVVVIYPLHKVF